MMKHLALACLALLLLSGPAGALDRYVPSQYPTIQGAVDAALPGDVVVVAPGIYADNVHQPPGDTTRCVVVMKDDITLRGGGAGLTIIDVNSRGRGIYCNGVTNATIENLTVREAFAATFGAGILCRDGTTVLIRNCEITRCDDGGIICIDSSPTITNSYLTNNVAKQGGGLSIEVGQIGTGSSPVVTGCVITGNRAPSGGGVFINGFTSEPVLESCIIDNNSVLLQAGNGGGFNITGALATISNCYIRSNVANGTGGGFNMEDCRVTLTNCRIQGNSNVSAFGPGGGIFAGYNSELTVVDCTIVGNMADGTDPGAGGGGVALSGTLAVILRQCTIARNGTPSGEGAGLACYGVDATVDKCIIAWNGPGSGMFCQDAVPVVTCTDVFGNEGGNLICGVNGGFNFSQDPRFCNMTTGDYRLQANSPCLPGQHPSGPGSCNGQRLGGEDLGCAPAVDAPDQFPFAPSLLQGNDPNPFVGMTTIHFDLPRTGLVDLRIFDVGGRLVRSLQNGTLPAGSHHAIWDGRNDQGETVPSGIYFYSLKTEGAGETRRMVLAR